MRVQVFKITQIIIYLANENVSLLDNVIVVAQIRVYQKTQVRKNVSIVIGLSSIYRIRDSQREQINLDVLYEL